MKYYLLKETEYFYDGHGTPEQGAFTKSVVTSEEYPDVTQDGIYIEGDYYELYLSSLEKTAYPDPNEFELCPEDFHEIMEFSAEDGYNCTVTEYDFKEITYEDFVKYSEIIGNYNRL